MKIILRNLLTTLATAGLVALLPLGALAEAPKSMRGVDVNAADPVATPKTYNGKRPGTQPTIARTFSAQPPVIPHAVENFDEITLEENQCLGCHGADVYKKKNAPMIGKSHFVDRDGKKHGSVVNSRYECVSCHVAQADAPVLVENTFKGDLAAPAKKK